MKTGEGKDERIKLTLKQVNDLAELAADEIATERSLKVAMITTQNRLSNIHKKKSAWWKDVIESHQLDPCKDWRTLNDGPFVEIVEDTRKESEKRDGKQQNESGEE